LGKSVAVGVMAHNEGATIESCLRSILAEGDGDVRFTSVVVVASGCTDATVDLVRAVMAEDERVRILVEDQRSGKAAAINWFLSMTEEPICAVISGDVILAPGALTHLVRALMEPEVGMAGGRPVPTNRRAGIVGNAVHVLWDLHHQIALQHPKMGEAVAFHRVFEGIDVASIVDEASIEACVIQAGGQLRYVPTAVIRNHGPETLAEYLLQRRRIHLGHLRLRQSIGHKPSTMGVAPLIRVASKTAAKRPRKAHYVAATVMLEAIARTHAAVDFALFKDRRAGTWTPIVSSKQVVDPGHQLRAYHEQTVELTLVPEDRSVPLAWWNIRWLRNDLLRILRNEDQLQIDSGSIRLRVHADPHALGLIIARLEAELSGWKAVPAPSATRMHSIAEARIA
jgi:poly-beta-1,6-N-acetyl-D-glucosamine synthase